MSESRVVMYTTSWCPYCERVRSVLAAKKVPIEEIDIEAAPEKRGEMQNRSGRRTVPQIFIGERHVGGFEEIADLDHKGELDPLLADLPRSS